MQRRPRKGSRVASPVGLALALSIAFLLIAAPSAPAYVYWASFNDNAIGRANNDSSGVNPHFISTGAGPNALAVDGTHIFWTNYTANSIGRANLDGTGVDNSFVPGIQNPSGIAVNSSNVYWTSLASGSVGRANLDGSSPSPSLVTGLDTACGVALDSGHVYYVNAGLGTSYIGRAGLNGSSPNNMFVTIPGSSLPCGVTVTTASIIWTDFGFLGKGTQIGRANTLNGMGPDPSFIGNAAGPDGITTFGTQLYWANSGTNTIGRANSDGTAVNQGFIATGGNVTNGVAVDGLVPSGAFTLGALKRNKRKGTAELPMTVTAAGSISVAGKGAQLARASAGTRAVAGAGTVTLAIKATGKSKKKLNDQGKVTLKLTITFSPTGGVATSQATSLKLIKR